MACYCYACVTALSSFGFVVFLQYIECGAKSQDPPNLPPASSVVVSNAVGTTTVASSATTAVSTVAVSVPATQPTHGAISRPATSAAVSTRVSTVH